MSHRVHCSRCRLILETVESWLDPNQEGNRVHRFERVNCEMTYNLTLRNRTYLK